MSLAKFPTLTPGCDRAAEIVAKTIGPSLVKEQARELSFAVVNALVASGFDMKAKGEVVTLNVPADPARSVA